MPLASRTPVAAPVHDPIYHQLNQRLRGLVRDGGYGPGAKFLTERAVSEQFGVSRVTANKALGSLVAEGLLEFRKGIGTFVRQSALDTDMRSLVSFTQRARNLGHRPSTRVLRFERLAGPEVDGGIRAALKLDAMAMVYFVERVRLADGARVILERRHVSAKACPGLTTRMMSGSFYTLLTERFGLRVTGAEQVIRATSLGVSEAGALGVQKGAPALWVHGVGLAGETPLWVEDTFYRGDRYEFHNRLGRQPVWLPARAELRTHH